MSAYCFCWSIMASEILERPTMLGADQQCWSQTNNVRATFSVYGLHFIGYYWRPTMIKRPTLCGIIVFMLQTNNVGRANFVKNWKMGAFFVLAKQESFQSDSYVYIPLVCLQWQYPGNVVNSNDETFQKDKKKNGWENKLPKYIYKNSSKKIPSTILSSFFYIFFSAVRLPW